MENHYTSGEITCTVSRVWRKIVTQRILSCSLSWTRRQNYIHCYKVSQRIMNLSVMSLLANNATILLFIFFRCLNSGRTVGHFSCWRSLCPSLRTHLVAQGHQEIPGYVWTRNGTRRVHLRCERGWLRNMLLVRKSVRKRRSIATMLQNVGWYKRLLFWRNDVKYV